MDQYEIGVKDGKQLLFDVIYANRLLQSIKY